MKKTMKIGIVGCGAIGHALAQVIIGKQVPGATLVGVFDTDIKKCKGLKRTPTLAKLVQLSELVIEAAGMNSVESIADCVLEYKKHLLVMSVGALLSQPDLINCFHSKNCHLYFPSGALAGLDALKAAKAGGPIKNVILKTTKPPQGLAGAPFFKTHHTKPEAIKKATTIFKGTAKQAVTLFPANINVAAAISLVGIGPDKTKVEIVADPKATCNRHALLIESSVGRIECITENVPSPNNPKTSYLATTSAMALLKSVITDERFGT